MATTSKLLRKGAYVQTRYGDRVTAVYGVVYEGALSRAQIIAAGETAGPPDDNVPPAMIPAWTGDIDGLPIVSRECDILSSTYAQVTVTASNATYYGGQPFDGRPRAVSQTLKVPFRIPHIRNGEDGVASIHYYDDFRHVATRVYSATSGLSQNEIADLCEAKTAHFFLFGTQNTPFVFDRYTIAPYQNNLLLVNLLFESHARIPSFPVDTFGNSVATPMLPVLARYTVDHGDVPIVGPPSPPSIGVMPHTARFDAGGSLTYFNPIGFQFN